MAQFMTFDPCLTQEQSDAMRALAVGCGAYSMYIQSPIKEGIGEGLVRRHDALLNHMRQAMEQGQLESLGEIAARTNLFRKTYADSTGIAVPGAEALFHHEGFLDAARALTDRPIVEPIMLYANFLLPGQELAIHTDTPEYRGISKLDVPEWLLVVMAHTGLFEQWRIRIATAVAFFAPCEGGGFHPLPRGPQGLGGAHQRGDQHRGRARHRRDIPRRRARWGS